MMKLHKTRKITPEQRHARSEALTEAAAHLRGTWTDDDLEFQQGLIIADQLDRLAIKVLVTPRGNTKT